MTPTLYSKPHCVQCIATKRRLDDGGAEYKYVDVSKDEEAMAKIKGLGYLQAPVVYISEDLHWSGNRPDLIDKHIL